MAATTDPAPADARLAALLDGLDRGERRALARLLTLAEDGSPAQLRAVVAALHARTGNARVTGVTGSPGVGKSTLTNALAGAFRARGRSVAILAVDPSSPFSGGALLGDRVRMQGHHADPDVFIRSMASRGHLGGLSFATPQAILVLDAAGFDEIIVETVGVGQSEVEIAASADTTVIALAPGMGDGVQAAKAGILEVADVFVINKADAPGAGKLAGELRGMLELGHATEDVSDPAAGADPADPAPGDGADGGTPVEPAWWPPIVRTVAVRDEGIDELLQAIEDHRAAQARSGRDVTRRRQRALHTIREIALEQVRRRFAGIDRGQDPLLASLATQVVGHDIDPYAAADQLLDALEGATSAS